MSTQATISAKTGSPVDPEKLVLRARLMKMGLSEGQIEVGRLDNPLMSEDARKVMVNELRREEKARKTGKQLYVHLNLQSRGMTRAPSGPQRRESQFND